jgi:hypothetical protein
MRSLWHVPIDLQPLDPAFRCRYDRHDSYNSLTTVISYANFPLFFFGSVYTIQQVWRVDIMLQSACRIRCKVRVVVAFRHHCRSRKYTVMT